MIVEWFVNPGKSPSRQVVKSSGPGAAAAAPVALAYSSFTGRTGAAM